MRVRKRNGGWGSVYERAWITQHGHIWASSAGFECSDAVADSISERFERGASKYSTTHDCFSSDR